MGDAWKEQVNRLTLDASSSSSLGCERKHECTLASASLLQTASAHRRASTAEKTTDDRCLVAEQYHHLPEAKSPCRLAAD